MGKFAEAAVQYDPDTRGDGFCVAGRWVSENLDEEDLAEFVRLANGHAWRRIMSLSGNELKGKALEQHVHGLCCCRHVEAQVGRACCTCNNKDV
jgi:hypothetical protein